MKKILIFLSLAGNLCQPACGVGLNSTHSLFSSIVNSIGSYSSQLSETFNEHKTVVYSLATLGAITLSAYFLRKFSHQTKNKDKHDQNDSDKQGDDGKSALQAQEVETGQQKESCKKDGEQQNSLSNSSEEDQLHKNKKQNDQDNQGAKELQKRGNQNVLQLEEDNLEKAKEQEKQLFEKRNIELLNQLIQLIRYENIEDLKILINQRSHLNRDEDLLDNENYLIETAINDNKNTDTLRYLIEELQLNYNAANDRQQNILHYAASHAASPAIIDYLLSLNNIDLNALDSNQSTPLHIAVLHSHKYLVASLINNNVKTEAKDTKGLTPLDKAKKIKNQAIISILNVAACEKNLVQNQ